MKASATIQILLFVLDHTLAFMCCLNSYPTSLLQRSRTKNRNDDILKMSTSTDVDIQFERLLKEGNTRKSLDLIRRAGNELKIDSARAETLLTQVGEAVLISAAPDSKVNTNAPSLEEEDLTYLYNELGRRNLLASFMSVTMDVVPYSNKYVSQENLEELTGMKMECLSPGKGDNSWAYAGATLCLAEVALAQYYNIDPLQIILPVTIGLFGFDRIALKGAFFESVARFVNPSYKAKIIKHEAGHMLLAYILGCPISGCILDPWQIRKYVRGGQGGTVFADPAFSKGLMTGNVTKSSVDRFSIILMGGIAAEAIMYGRAEGGASDEATMIELLSLLQPPFTYSMIKIQARWAALQAVLLLREYRTAYDDLVVQLEKNQPVGTCIMVIERAIQSEKSPKPVELRRKAIIESENIKKSTSQSTELRRSIEKKLKEKDIETIISDSNSINDNLSKQLKIVLSGRKLGNKKLEGASDEGGIWLSGFDVSKPFDKEADSEKNKFLSEISTPEKEQSTEIQTIDSRIEEVNKRLQEIRTEQDSKKKI